MSEPDSTPRRRPPTIDLTAKEVGAEPAEPAPNPAAADASGERASSGNATKARGRRNSRLGSYAVGILIGAVVAGGAAAGLWAAGFMPRRDTTVPAAAPVAKTMADDHVSARLDKIEHALQTPRADDGAAGFMTAVEAQNKSLGDALAALSHRVDDIAAASQTALTQAKSAAAAADDAKSAAEGAKSANASGVQHSDLDALASRVAALESAVKSLTADNAQRSASQNDNAARATIAAEALRAAVERGVPFQSELAAVKSFGADQDAIGALAPFAAGGVPTAKALGRELATLTPSLQRAADSAMPAGSLLGRLEARAQRLVRVTPIDTAAAPASHDVSSLIGRIEADAARGDIEAALADLAKLPDGTRAPAVAWIKRAQARETALAASRRIAAAALAALAKPASQ
ncbi:MAG: hypothetical protein KGI48_04125 [Hyphomicrobiales bacterium]|nr:hypothetical protein [Hyphomicrobiales bacterium]